MDAQTRELYVVTEEGTPAKLISNFNVEEGSRNFDPKTAISDEEIEKINKLLQESVIDMSEVEPILLNVEEYNRQREHNRQI